jgi:hypothetical protein
MCCGRRGEGGREVKKRAPVEEEEEEEEERPVGRVRELA